MTAPRIAASISASANTTNGALPPSSKCGFFTVEAAWTIIFLPVSVSPVMDIIRTSDVHQRFSDHASRSSNHIQHARRNAGFVRGSSHLDGGQRGQTGWLNDNGIACGPAKAPASRQPCSSDSSKVRSSLPRLAVPGVSSFDVRDVLHCRHPWHDSGGGSKNRKLSMEKGMSNVSVIMIGFPVCDVSSFANSSARSFRISDHF